MAKKSKKKHTPQPKDTRTELEKLDDLLEEELDATIAQQQEELAQDDAREYLDHTSSDSRVFSPGQRRELLPKDPELEGAGTAAIKLEARAKAKAKAAKPRTSKKAYSDHLDEMRRKGYVSPTRDQFCEMIGFLMSLDQEDMLEFAQDPQRPMWIRMIIDDLMHDKKRSRMMQDYRDWMFGKAQVNQDIKITGESNIFETLKLDVKPQVNTLSPKQYEMMMAKKAQEAKDQEKESQDAPKDNSAR